MPKTVGKLFRHVVIDADLREWVDTILIAPTEDDPLARDAVRRIREKATPATSYLYAVEIRNYLEQKTRIGSEPRLFTLAGDLFLDALEANLPDIGPNFLRDHYNGVLGCYKDGNDPAKAIEGPLYCLDLALLRALDLAMESEVSSTPDATTPAFAPQEGTSRATRVGDCLRLAEDALHDAVRQAFGAAQGEVPKGLIDFVAAQRERLGGVLKSWTALLRGISPEAGPIDSLRAGCDVAKQARCLPLVAGIEERAGLLCEPAGDAARLRGKYFYDAADLLVGQGNMERESGAYNMAQRRYARAVELFGRIPDRTSMAKALVEQARLYIRKGGDGEHIHHSLHKAVCLVVAHRDGLPLGRLPVLDAATVQSFLQSKGYGTEARAYAASLNGSQA